MAFVELNIKTSPEFVEIFIAELGEIGFETFQEIDGGLLAYVEDELLDENKVNDIVNRYANFTTVKIAFKTIEKENWNKEWEKNYDPIEIGDKCIVRATFHKPKKEYQHEIIINPKMSFGTGHHATTWQMLMLQMEINHDKKNILDVGSGTGILAIMAMKLGAGSITATDIDEWCMENSRENFALNNISAFDLKRGTIEKLDFNESFDIILANINKNVLLKEIPYYSKLLMKKGHLLLSGFYQNDIEAVKKVATKNNLSLSKSVSKDNWAALLFMK